MRRGETECGRRFGGDGFSGRADRRATRGLYGRGLERVLALLLFGLLGLGANPLSAQQDPVVWNHASELSVLLSGGNSGASTLGFRHSIRRIAGAGELRLDAAALRTDAVRVRRVAEGSGPGDFEVREERERERSAERYSLGSRYDRTLSERFFAFGGLSWDRNAFAGFNHRTVGVTGAGNQWGPGGEEWRLKVGYGVTYTIQRDVTPDPGRDDSYVGARLTLDHLQPLGTGTVLEVTGLLDGNAQEFGDFRGELTPSVSSSLGSRLSLKTTLQLLWDNEPPLERLPLLLPDGTSAGEDVLVPLRKLDHNLSVAVVFTF